MKPKLSAFILLTLTATLGATPCIALAFSPARAMHPATYTSREAALSKNAYSSPAKLHELAKFYRLEGNYEQAEKIAQEELRRIDPVRDNKTYRHRLRFLSELKDILNKPEQAEQLYAREYALSHFTADDTTLARAELLHKWGMANESLKRYPQAEAKYNDELDLYARKFGDDSLQLVGPLHSLARTYEVQKNYKQAQALYERQLVLEVSAFGADAFAVTNDYLDLARMSLKLRDLAVARGYYQKAADIYKKDAKANDSLIRDLAIHLQLIDELAARIARR